MKTVRCAIYTRKSSDEGLEQSFNSLDAQREACAAYILSQASEGWSEVAEHYDDGGLSGGTLERPALQRLLAAVAGGRIDIIVVYKVDRLTRSLLDFAKLVEAFDKADTSFVSITQSFNTTTSMGRLTLNMLLSFAQFEREVTAERIRDKLAASKAKGMWMGGIPPIGYKPDGRSLAIVEEHAEVVRRIFIRYLSLGSVRLLQKELTVQQVRVPQRTTGTGKATGGGRFTRGQLYHLLKNVTYSGRIGHKEKVYPGLHTAIVPPEQFEQVQVALADHLQGSRRPVRTANPSLLAGKLVDAAGERLIATHATKGKARYRYYVSQQLHHGRANTGLRIPAREIESLVAERVAGLFSDPLEFTAYAGLELPVHRLVELDARCRTVRAALLERASTTLPHLVEQVCIGETGVTITCAAAAAAELLGMATHHDVARPIKLYTVARLTRSGHAMRLVQANGGSAATTADPAIIRLLIRARQWWSILRAGSIGVTELASREDVTRSYLCRVVRLAFLSPAVVEALLAGRQRAGVNVAMLMPENAVATDWREQRLLLLPAS